MLNADLFLIPLRWPMCHPNPPQRITFVALLTLSLLVSSASRAATHELDRSRQCAVVLTNDWASNAGVMQAFERGDTNSGWRKHGPAFAVVVGKNGLGLGRGLVRLNMKAAPNKKEGDDRAPAGVFRLSSAFGYAPASSVTWIKLPYLALSKQTEGIDDPKSRYYNKLVDRSKITRIDWRSSEEMRRDDILYKWGVIVGHNPAALPSAGSCIFLHIWKNSSAPTAGCTAMPENELLQLLRWLDPAQHPILVQMPQAVYRSLRARYDLPMAEE